MNRQGTVSPRLAVVLAPRWGFVGRKALDVVQYSGNAIRKVPMDLAKSCPDRFWPVFLLATIFAAGYVLWGPSMFANIARRAHDAPIFDRFLRNVLKTEGLDGG